MKVDQLADSLKGKLSDPTLDTMEVAQAYEDGDIDTEGVVRMAHGTNMNVVYNILSDYTLEKSLRKSGST